MKSRVRSPGEGPDKDKVWLVSFWADWCETCNFLEPTLASLSVKYGFGPDGVEFGKVDVVKYPELAEEFRIDTSGTTSQLPSVVMFYRGLEVKRLPPFKSDGTVVKTKIDRKGIEKYFELENGAGGMSFRKKKGGKVKGKSKRED